MLKKKDKSDIFVILLVYKDGEVIFTFMEEGAIGSDEDIWISSDSGEPVGKSDPFFRLNSYSAVVEYAKSKKCQKIVRVIETHEEYLT